MQPIASSPETLSVIGFFLTLFGLLGSLFYIHLSDWLREVLALETKWEINRTGEESDQKSGRRQCRYEIVPLASWHVLATSLVVTAFVLFIFILSLLLWLGQVNKSIAWFYIGYAGIVFMLIYLSMTVYLLIWGYSKARRLWKAIRQYFDS
jgi:hypothetical protein